MNGQFPILADHVSHVLIDGEGVLLNQKTGKYLGLNAVGMQILEMSQAGQTIEQIIAHLAAQYRIEKGIIQRDVGRFLEQAVKHELVVFSPEAGPRADCPPYGVAPVLSKDVPLAGVNPGLLLILRAYVLLFVIDWRLKFRTFDAVLKWLNIKSKKAGATANSSATERTVIQQVRHAVDTATKFYYRTRKDCLPNAMLAYYLMKKRGAPVKFCIGVAKFPFKGHAWVEYEGKVVYTTPASLWQYRAIMKV